MLYFAYGSNLNHAQMRYRCDGAKYLKKHTLKGYKLCFSHKTNHSVYGHANIIKNKKSEVNGALWNITKKHEKELDGYEGVDYNFFDVIDGMADALMGIAKQETVSNSYATSATALNSGSAFNLTVSVGKTSPTNTTINVTTDTPEGVVTAINASSTGLKAKLAKEDPSSDVVRVYIEGPGGEEGIFTISSTPNMGFSNNDTVQKGIGRVSDSKNRATDALVGIGVSMSVVNEKKDVNEERDLAIKKLISSEKDLDYALAVTELSSEIIALEALQSSFAKISQMSLFDYLR